jgi:hypothetical protein
MSDYTTLQRHSIFEIRKIDTGDLFSVSEESQGTVAGPGWVLVSYTHG